MDPEKMRKGKCFRVENTHTLEVARGSHYREKTKTLEGASKQQFISLLRYQTHSLLRGLILTVFELMKGLSTTHSDHYIRLFDKRSFYIITINPPSMTNFIFSTGRAESTLWPFKNSVTKLKVSNML